MKYLIIIFLMASCTVRSNDPKPGEVWGYEDSVYADGIKRCTGLEEDSIVQSDSYFVTYALLNHGGHGVLCQVYLIMRTDYFKQSRHKLNWPLAFKLSPTDDLSFGDTTEIIKKKPKALIGIDRNPSLHWAWDSATYQKIERFFKDVCKKSIDTLSMPFYPSAHIEDSDSAYRPSFAVDTTPVIIVNAGPISGWFLYSDTLSSVHFKVKDSGINVLRQAKKDGPYVILPGVDSGRIIKLLLKYMDMSIMNDSERFNKRDSLIDKLRRIILKDETEILAGTKIK